MPLLFSALLLRGFVPPGPEVEDGHYRDSTAMTQRWFEEPAVELHTPGAVEARWSTVEEAYAMLERLAASRAGLSVREVGESLNGAPIKALFHEAGRKNALTVLIQARVHGNEPAATEGALELAHALAVGDLSELDINVIILPVLNPEGARAMRRRTDTDIDPNRDYIRHNSGCIRAVYRLLREHDPAVVLDMHEHDAYAWPYDLMTIGPNNPNIPAPVREFTDGVMIGGIAEAFAAAGLRVGPYRLLDYPEGQVRVRESASTFVSAKNALALSGRISLLAEGRGIGLGDQHFRRRTVAQYTAARAVVETAARNEARIQQLVSAARRAIATGIGEWILRVDPVKVPAQHALVDARTLEAQLVATTYWERSNGTVAATMKAPAGYLIRAGQAALMDRLHRVGLEGILVTETREFEVETLTVEHFEPGNGILYGGELKRADGAVVRPAVLSNHAIAIRTRHEPREFPSGSWIIPVNQANALHLIALEPAALSGFAATGHWGDELPAGFEFPVYRLTALPESMDQGVGDEHRDDPAQHRD